MRSFKPKIFQERGDRYCFAAASTLSDVEKLIKDGFEYVTDMESKKLFRKPK